MLGAPEDWVARMILADALEDCGEPLLAAGQRWQAENHKYPSNGDNQEGLVYWWDASCYGGMYDGPEPLYTERTLFKAFWHGMIPHELFALAYLGEWDDRGTQFRGYGTAQKAEKALALTLRRMKQ